MCDIPFQDVILNIGPRHEVLSLHLVVLGQEYAMDPLEQRGYGSSDSHPASYLLGLESGYGSSDSHPTLKLLSLAAILDQTKPAPCFHVAILMELVNMSAKHSST